MIDWNDKKAKISENFTVGEATYLPSWKIYHIPSEQEKINILKTAEKLELIRNYAENSVNINVWIRPIMVNCPGSFFHGKNYNQMVGGAPGSAHITGCAADFTISKITCVDARHLLVDKLEEFDIRMENNGTGNWIHIDTFPPKPNRFFKP